MLKRRQVYLIALVVAAGVTLPWGFLPPRGLDDLRNLVFDSFQRLSPRAYDPETPARVVGVDEETLKAYGQWPWSRTRIAEPVDRLREMGAAAIAFDFIFAEPDRLSARRIAEALPDPRLRAEVSKLLAKAPAGRCGALSASSSRRRSWTASQSIPSVSSSAEKRANSRCFFPTCAIFPAFPKA